MQPALDCIPVIIVRFQLSSCKRECPAIYVAWFGLPRLLHKQEGFVGVCFQFNVFSQTFSQFGGGVWWLSDCSHSALQLHWHCIHVILAASILMLTHIHQCHAVILHHAQCTVPFA